MNAADRAITLMSLGYTVVPTSREKRPLVEWWIYQFRSMTIAEALDLFGVRFPQANAAFVTGRTHDLVVVDADTPEAEALIANRGWNSTRRTITRRGKHHLFRHPGVQIVSKTYEVAGVKIDIKGDRAICTAPGSTHATGHVYAADGDWQSPPPFLPTDLVMITAYREVETPAQVREFPEADSETRFMQYLRKHPIPPIGSGSDRACFNAACFAFSVGLSDEGVIEILHRETGFDVRWLAVKVRSARRKALH